MRYYISNQTKHSVSSVQGNFPDVTEELDKGDKIIIISTYSNTVKVPHCTVLNGINEWDWEDYPLPNIPNYF